MRYIKTSTTPLKEAVTRATRSGSLAALDAQADAQRQVVEQRAILVQYQMAQFGARVSDWADPLEVTAGAGLAGLLTGFAVGAPRGSEESTRRPQNQPLRPIEKPGPEENPPGQAEPPPKPTIQSVTDAGVALGMSLLSRYLFSSYLQPLIDEHNADRPLSRTRADANLSDSESNASEVNVEAMV